MSLDIAGANLFRAGDIPIVIEDAKIMTEQLIQQKDRLLEVDTPIGKDVLFLTKLDGVESVSSLFEFHLHLISQNSGVDPKDLLDKSITVTINQKNNQPRYINGLVKSWVKGSKNYQGFQAYQAIIVPDFWHLTQSSSCDIYQNLSVPKIFSKVCKANGFNDFDVSQLESTYLPREYCVQYNETMFDFLSRLLEEEGIYYSFQHSKDKHIMFLSDQSGLAPKLIGNYIHKNVHYDEAHIHDWSLSKEIHSNKISSSDYNYNAPLSDLIVNASAQETSKFLQSSNLNKFYYPGNYQDQSDGENIVSRKIKSEVCSTKIIKGSGNYLDFIPGSRFQLQSHEDQNQQDEYFLTTVHHKAHDQTHLSEGESKEKLSQSYLNEFSCLSTKSDYIPKEKTKKPKILESQ